MNEAPMNLNTFSTYVRSLGVEDVKMRDHVVTFRCGPANGTVRRWRSADTTGWMGDGTKGDGTEVQSDSDDPVIAFLRLLGQL